MVILPLLDLLLKASCVSSQLMLGQILTKPKLGVALGGAALASVTLLSRLSQLSSESQKEERFISSFGNPSELQRLEAFKRILHSPNCEEDDMGDFESSSWLRKRRKQLFAIAKGDVLEVGIGSGSRSLPYLASNTRVTGITAVDILPEALELCKRVIETIKPEKPVTLIQADMNSLPFNSGRFDTVISCFTICSAEDPIGYLKELGRVCQGNVLLLEHGLSRYYPLRWLGRLLGAFPNVQAPWDSGCYQDRSPVDLCRAAGLRIVSVKYYLLGHVSLIVARGEPDGIDRDCKEAFYSYSTG